MFDAIGRPRGDAGRRAGPFLLSVLLNGSVIVGMLWAGGQRVQEAVQEIVVPVVYVDVLEPHAPAGGPAAPTPAPAPRPTTARAPIRAVEAEAVVPEGVDVRAALASVDIGLAVTGSGGGGGGSSGNGTARLGTGSGGGAKSVHWSEVKVKTRAIPSIPGAARSLGLDEIPCRVRFFVDEAGVPTDVALEDCPSVLHATTRTAAWKWRFYPMLDQGRPVPAQFVLTIRYRPAH